MVLRPNIHVCNVLKQGGILSPILFVVYIDGLLGRLKESGIGCQMDNSYVRVWVMRMISNYFVRH